MKTVSRLLCLLFAMLGSLRTAQASRFAFVDYWTGEYGCGPGQMSSPYDVKVDQQGNVYVVDQYCWRVLKIAKNGHITTWSGPPDGFYYPNALAVDSDLGVVYVADSGHRIVKLSAESGRVLKIWGQEGDNNGEFLEVKGIAVSGEHNVYVTDGRRHKVQEFDQNGTFIRKWGGRSIDNLPGTKDGWFNVPSGIAVYGDSVFVGEEQNHRIQAFGLDGKFIKKFEFSRDKLNFPEGLAIQYDETRHDLLIWVAESGSFKISAISYKTGEKIAEYGGGQPTRLGSIDTGGVFSSPHGVAIGPDDHIFVADTGHYMVYEFANLSLKAKTSGFPRVHGGNSVLVKAFCNQECDITGTAKLTAGGKTFGLRLTPTTLPSSNISGKFGWGTYFPLSDPALTAIRKALNSGQSVSVTASLRFEDSDGNAVLKKTAFQLTK